VPAQAANVESLSNDVLKHQGEDAYWQAMVKCDGNSTSIPIKQVLKQQDWCSESTLLPCATSKMRMAQQVCVNIDIFSKNTATSVAARKPPTPPSRQPATVVNTPSKPSGTWQQDVNTQRQAEQRAQERQRRAEVTAAIRAEELKLQVERQKLEQEKRALARAEREFAAEERQLEARLRALEN
jgi:hypothetical protein